MGRKGAENPDEEAAEKAVAQTYDLTSRMIPFLDRHLIFPVLNTLQEVGIYKKEDVVKAEIKLLSETCMVLFAIEKYNTINEEVPKELHKLHDQVLEKVSSMRDRVLDLLKILEDDNKVKKIPNFASLDAMCLDFNLEPEIVDELLRYAKLQFECGNYKLSGELLKHYRNMRLSPETLTQKDASCLWGSLACEILKGVLQDADGENGKAEAEAVTDLIQKLDEYLENSKAPKREVLLQRTWLLHWTLFAIFSMRMDAQMLPKILDLFLNEKSLSIISLSCPHLFRYVGACLILQKRLKHLVKETVWIIHHESGSYTDPVTRFLLALYTEMDFDDAQQELQKCELLCKGDHFLAPHWAEFQENARLHIFESYCRIHQCINIQMIASKLNMQAVEAEVWIVKLIQSAKLDARIDSEKSTVVMTKAPPNVYQQVIEKTKNLAFRSTMLVSNLEKS